MEFKDLQDIWNRQNDEELFEINEQALHDAIKRKSRSVSRLMALVSWLIIVANLLVGLFLLSDALQENEPDFQFVIAAAYIAYSVLAVIRHLRRRREERRFDPTILGELNKAIWQVDYLIHQGRSMIRWYLIPLLLVIALSLFLSDTSPWVGVLVLMLLPASYFGARWEISKWYLPKKRTLESLREQLVSSEAP